MTRILFKASLLFTLFFLLTGVLSGYAAEPPVILLFENFEHGLNPGWQGKSFIGETDYRVVHDEQGYCLQAESRAAASGLFCEIDFDPRDYPILSWRWKIDHTITKGNGRTKAGDDYAARIYVVFPHWFFPLTRTLNYIWANRLPKGAVIPSAYAENSIMIAVESGPEKAGQWVAVRRNVVEDYRRAFGEEPPRIGAIALMTDTDDTGEQALAWYDDVTISRAQDLP